ADARNRSVAASGGTLADEILNLFPPDTETVVVAQEPFTIREPDQTKAPVALELARGYVLGLLGAVENEELSRALIERTVRLAALGAREFRNNPPDACGGLSLASIAYLSCVADVITEPVTASILSRLL